MLSLCNILIWLKENTIQDNIKFLKTISILLNLLAIYCIIEYIIKFNPIFSYFMDDSIAMLYTTKNNSWIYRVTGSATNSIVMGNLMLFSFMLNLYFLNKRNLILILLNLATIIFTFTKSVYLSLLLGVIFYILKNLKLNNKNIISFFLIAIIILGLSIFTQLPEAIQLTDTYRIIEFRFNNLFDQISYMQRISTINFILEKISSDSIIRLFFGHGPGSIKYLIKDQTQNFVVDLPVIDNQYFTFLYEYGINFFIIAVTTLIYFIATNKLKRINDKRISKLHSALITVLFMYLITIGFYDGFYWHITNFFLSFIIAYLIYLYRLIQNGL